MSEYVVCETPFDDQDALVDALKDIGVPNEHIEVHESAVTLNGWNGRTRAESAQVVVRKGHIGASADIGFERQKDGNIKLWMDHMDAARGVAKKIAGNDLKQAYSKAKILRAAASLKHKMKIGKLTKNGGKVRIELHVK